MSVESEVEVVRTVQHYAVVIETTNGAQDGRALPSWVEDRILNSPRSPRDGQFIAVAKVDEQGKVLRTATHGTPKGDSYEIVEDLFDVKGTT